MRQHGDANSPLLGVPYFAFLGIEARDDEAWCLPRDDRHVGDASRQSLHGGVLAAFLEAAAFLHLRPGANRVTTIDFTSDFVRPAAVADTIATVMLVRRGRRFANVRVDAWQGEPANIVAVGHGSFWLG